MLGVLAPQIASAQIVPDTTLPVNSSVIQQGQTQVIDKGTTRGGNLFHSFEHFSVPRGVTAYFNSSEAIQNIFSRVTGRFPSNLDGILTANGTANLFILNPNGIIFGPNAVLNLGGSFLGTTSSAVEFPSGIKFSAVKPQASSLLTVDLPVSLQLGTSPGSIQVQGEGHDLNGLDLQPALEETKSTGLSVKLGRTLALIGGGVRLDGGVLMAPSGHIEVGSAKGGTVALAPIASGWGFSYTNISSFADISLSKRSLISGSGFGGGSINIRSLAKG